MGFWAVEDRSTEHLLGWVSLRYDNSEEVSDDNKSTIRTTSTIGYRFIQSCWGQGFATEARLLDYGFGQSNSCLQQVHATTYDNNLGSIRVMWKN
jgi:RimJ/RimL family protein N-acetyltransferase